MEPPPTVLLTNDDGFDAVGLQAMYDALSPVADVTVIAPVADQSGVSRANSREFSVEERTRGFAIDGTPVDCVHYGRGGLDRAFDVVVSGCNDGPNLGSHKIERSGTVAAAIEAAFLGIPGIALSLYAHPEGSREFSRRDYVEAERVVKFLVEQVIEGSVPDAVDYLNVNVPAGPDGSRMRLTEPTRHFDVRIDELETDTYRAWDHFYDPLAPSVDVEMTDPVGTDRRSVADEEVSVSPLSVRHHLPAVDGLARAVSHYQQPT